MKEVISFNELNVTDIEKILNKASEVEKGKIKYSIENKILASVFFEPSTRTKISFTSAMYRLGGNVIDLDAGGNNSLKKGESLSDTLKMMELYTDIIVIRSPYEGVARLGSEILDIPVINAGDGSNQHPTQTLLDLYTIKKECNKLSGLKIGFVGDLKYGRTVHSLCLALDKYPDNIFYFVAPIEMQIPEYIKKKINLKFILTEDLDEIIGDIDILYMTRIQKERFELKNDFEKCRGKYKIDIDTLKKCKPSMKILHPLPRVDEISKKLDDSSNAIYFLQAKNGLYVRMAIILLLLENHEKKTPNGIGKKCTNKKCITMTEDLENKYLTIKGENICFYCEKKI